MAPLDPLLDDLNDAQREAVLHGDGPLLIHAGAGTGKTRVLTRRVGHLVRDRGIDPERILAVTFTNKAAREMKDRVGLDSRAWVMTFHSFCARLLRIEGPPAPRDTEFSIADTADRRRAVKRILKDQDRDASVFRPADAASFIGQWKTKGRAPATLSPDDWIEEVYLKVYTAYEEHLRRSNLLDFDDLLIEAVALLEGQRGESWAQRFQHLLVDEYQDTNPLQYRITRALAAAHGNVTAVGDPDQSIYRWRGADIGNILNFEEDFPGAATLTLERNYRSTPSILAAAESLIENNTERKAKRLWTEGEEGDQVHVESVGDEREEAREIVGQVRGWIADGGRAGGVAVFYRTNFLQRAIERALAEARIPYEVVGGTEFFERTEVRDMIAWLRLVVNTRDEESLLRVLGAPPCGIGAKTQTVLTSFARERGLGLLEAFGQVDQVEGLGAAARRRVEAFSGRVAILARDASDGMPVADLIGRIVTETGFEAYLDKMDNPEDRLENLRELQVFATERDRSEVGLRGFLEEVALLADVDALEDDSDRVHLMTLHTAKGLEFPCVVVTGCEEGLLPHSRTEEEEGEAGVEEERRLLYVGMTRAQQRLILTHAQRRSQYGEFSWRLRSRFLDEIPAAASSRPAPAWDAVDSPFDEPAGDSWVRAGTKVEHPTFGVGTVRLVSGSGRNQRAQVVFPRAGERTLLLEYAGLRPLEGSS